MTACDAEDLVWRLHVALERGHVPVALFVEWDRDGAEAWATCRVARWLLAIAKRVAPREHTTATFALDGHRARVSPWVIDDCPDGPCCAAVVRALVPAPTAEALAGRGRAAKGAER